MAHGVAGKIEVGLGDEGRPRGKDCLLGEDKAFRLNGAGISKFKSCPKLLVAR